MILGNKLEPSVIRGKNFDVIDVGEVTGNGNTIIRAGSTYIDGTWQQSLHIVLIPAERERLITVLTQQRNHEDVIRRERIDATQDWPKSEGIGDEGLRTWVLYGDHSQVSDPWYSLIVEWESERKRKHNG